MVFSNIYGKIILNDKVPKKKHLLIGFNYDIIPPL
jgi:hypothetical protein